MEGSRRPPRHKGRRNNGARASGRKKNSNVCFQFQKDGSCRFGDKCRFDHISGQGEELARKRKKEEQVQVDEVKRSKSEEKEEEKSVSGSGGNDNNDNNDSQRDNSIFTNIPFTSLQDLSPPSKAALKEMKFVNMTVIQSKAIPPALEGKDVMVRAKTGHGKTLAFAVPVFELLHKYPATQVLVINPTRELALQTMSVFKVFAKHHNTICSCVIGGRNFPKEVKQFKREVPSVLVGTPGRILAHLEEKRNLLKNMSFLVLDEADRLLDEGFQVDVGKIFSKLPEIRQTLLASATLPLNLSKYKHMVLRDNHVLANAFHKEDSSKVNKRLEEQYCVVTDSNWFQTLCAVLLNARANGEKTMVFFQAANETKLVAFLLQQMSELTVFEIHSRMNQNKRIQHLEKFSKTKGSVLCSSDVGARGWDIQNVDLVVSVGMPSDADTYVHRVGRTARAGTHGRALLMMFPWEEKYFVRQAPRLKNLRTERVQPTQGQLDRTAQLVKNARAKPQFETNAQKGFQALLGFQNSFKKKCGMSAEMLVENITGFMNAVGCHKPYLTKRTAGKMHLRGTRGL